MSFRSTIFAAFAALSSAHPYLEARQAVNGTNSTSGLNSSVTDFIYTEQGVSLTGAIANIGGTNDSVVGDGPFPGVVVASPSIVNPNYFYTWTRDSALTLLMLADAYVFGNTTVGNNSIQRILEDYTTAQAELQPVTNPSGTFYPAGQGLAEPKFYTNLTRYDGTWGRPQNDGPALRATTLMEISEVIFQNNPNASQIVYDTYWPIILNDLKYVGQWWNSTSYDLWEEVNGNSFFTTTAQHRALVQGSIWAERLNTTCEPCEEAAQILCFLENNFWNETGNYLLANINANQVTRTQINADPILAAMHAFDINATCDAASLQPCNPRVLATHKVWVDSFRNLYPINQNATAPAAVACGRYPEDTYYGGNPWYITTLAAAEVLYDAVAQISKAGTYNINNESLPFFQDIYPDASEATYSGDNLTNITDAMLAYADGFVSIIQQYTPENGTLSEQINATTGEPLSANALTWSFAAFVTMSERRAGNFPPSWGANTTMANTANDTCVWSYYNSTFTYTPAVAAGANASVSTYSNDTGCLTDVTFYVLANCTDGNTVFISGNNTLFNNSINDTAALVQPLHTNNITMDDPVWFVNLWFPAGESIEYQYVLANGTAFVQENITRTVTASSCGGPLVATNDTISVPYGVGPA